MSASPSRRSGAVGVLVVAVLVVGAAPVLAAPPVDPPAAAAGNAGGGRAEAPGQEKQASTPAVGPPTGIVTGSGSDPAEPAPRSKPVSAPAVAEPAPAAPASKRQGRGEPAVKAPTPAAAGGPPVVAPRSVRPATGPVALVVGPVPVRVAAPVSVPVMGPHVPWTSRPSALASAGSRSGRARAAAAAPVRVRPAGTGPIVLPAVHPQPPPVDLGEALPAVAVQTVGAVARTPEWPLGIAVVVLLFLLVQNRIDRRDPKLSASRVEDEAPLEFAPLDGHPHLRLVVAA